MKKFKICALLLFLALFSSQALAAEPATVYFTRDISPAGLLKLYS